MKVLHVSSYYRPHIGGMETAVAQICEGLAQRGHQVSLYTSRDPSRSLKLENGGAMEIRRFDVLSKPMRNPLTRGIFKAILRNNAQIVHAHDEHAYTSNAAVAARVLRDRPLVLHCYGELAAASRLEKALVNLYDLTLNRSGYHIADIIIQISPSFVPYVERKFGISSKKIRVIRNAIDPTRYELGADPEEFRRHRDLPEGKWILYVGALIDRKGIRDLIQILPEVVKEGPAARLLIVGQGPLRYQIMRSVEHNELSSHVFFLSGLSQGELSAAYRMSKLLVLPTYADAAPGVILEAMLFQRPVVSTNILGIAEFFSETAILVGPGNRSDLKEAVLRLLRDDELSTRLGEAGHKLLLKDFRWTDRVDEVAKIYESLS